MKPSDMIKFCHLNIAHGCCESLPKLECAQRVLLFLFIRFTKTNYFSVAERSVLVAFGLNYIGDYANSFN
ncbi:hypothetical protein VNO78_23719 [Psophocarpus tetragonolobus]|uniref:Uncharacterized protein n=1 Tax=Psophocarpus tetragonolobus TaxID=3891 RepID=A0AAN9S449_PSOTE